MTVSSGWAAFSLTHSTTYVVYKWANSLIPKLNKIMIHFGKAPKKLFIFEISTISLGANFRKASIFFSLLDPKSGKGLICVAYMTGALLGWLYKFIVAAKFLKWGIFKGTIEPPKLYILTPG